MFCEDVNDSVTSRHVSSGSRLELLDPARSHDSDRSRRDLCSVCSQNQLLKIKQLANFVPQNEVSEPFPLYFIYFRLGYDLGLLYFSNVDI